MFLLKHLWHISLLSHIQNPTNFHSSLFHPYLQKQIPSKYVLRKTTSHWCWVGRQISRAQQSRRRHGSHGRRQRQLPVVKQCKKMQGLKNILERWGSKSEFQFQCWIVCYLLFWFSLSPFKSGSPFPLLNNIYLIRMCWNINKTLCAS